ncbi:hypothetical protein Lesp02_25800 [Lentzea sp. NBRC 105346]|uniref:GrpB family protein n=1 Tax=Lentzea sp. NBRC 105346 TaxID=3032205 RepID=UPI0025558E1A|nr:GrpB family protein [Lentzea sp. NBRC 105346]GLZ30391.1 hypothetical protein Lesp02_25800 [Lentzea sp. NBRC 105346]
MLDPLLAGAGFERAHGSRPDSPGVRRDNPRGTEQVPDSPFGRYTVRFRDWLIANPDQRARYQELKIALAETHADDPDYDDYTRAKTAFFDEIQHHLGRSGPDSSNAGAPAAPAS